jgi:DNA-binding MarR family transcriptional regulator
MYMQQLDPVHAVDEAARRLADEVRHACLGIRVGRLHRLVGRRFDEALRPLGVTVAQMEVLGALTLISVPARPADLVRRLAIERSTVSRNLALLEKRGYVTATETSPTGRSLRVTITAEGRALYAQTEDAWRKAQLSLVDQLGADSVPTLDRWLVTLTGAT